MKDLSTTEKKTTGDAEQRANEQHKKGKLTARERLDLLLDPGSFSEIGVLVTHRASELGLAEKRYPGDAVVTGSGRIDGRPVMAYSQDFTILGGTISEVVGEKIGRIMELALENRVPVIGIFDSGGARIQEGVEGLAGVGNILFHNTLLSGIVPQISIVVGPSAGGSVYGPAITDFIFTVEGITQMYITGPDVIKAVTGEEISHQHLGGAEVHARKSGVAHFMCKSEDECFIQVKRLLSYLPQNNQEMPLLVKTDDPPERTADVLNEIIPRDARTAYDMKKVIKNIVDNGEFLEVHQEFAPNIITGFGRFGGRSSGIVAQQPLSLAGAIDIKASIKAARFVRFCDAFNIPIVTLVDTPGFLPGIDQEHDGIIKEGAKLIYAYSEATVPKVTFVLRKAYGGAYIVMSSKHLKSDICYAWPTAEIAVMGAEGAVNIIYRKEITLSPEPEKTRERLIKEYEEKFYNPNRAVERGYIDDIITPSYSRPKIVEALEILSRKQVSYPPRKHGNIPL